MLDRLPIRERSSQPTHIDVGHGAVLGSHRQILLGLLLGADEQDRTSLGHGISDQVVGFFEANDRLLKVDDVNAVALGEDERFHLGVPPLGAVAKVHS